MSSATISWAGIEHEELDSKNWVQVSFRWNEGIRVYRVFGEIGGEPFSEEFDFDNTKVLAYEFYREKLAILENGSVVCIECGEYATNAEFANAVSQTGGYCLDCAPDDSDTEATRWH